MTTTKQVEAACHLFVRAAATQARAELLRANGFTLAARYLEWRAAVLRVKADLLAGL